MTAITHAPRPNAVPRRPSLARFVAFRLGSGSQGEQLANLLLRPFAAPSFMLFWRAWNPLYGYYLYYWCCRPLQRVLPRRAAELVTFSASGLLLHDTLIWVALRGATVPYMTIWFTIMGAISVAAQARGYTLRRASSAVRVAANVTYLASTFVLMFVIVAAF